MMYADLVARLDELQTEIDLCPTEELYAERETLQVEFDVYEYGFKARNWPPRKTCANPICGHSFWSYVQTQKYCSLRCQKQKRTHALRAKERAALEICKELGWID
jgi:hypothetical protein